jgi:hypothetical protein
MIDILCLQLISETVQEYQVSHFNQSWNRSPYLELDLHLITEKFEETEGVIRSRKVSYFNSKLESIERYWSWSVSDQR